VKLSRLQKINIINSLHAEAIAYSMDNEHASHHHKESESDHGHHPHGGHHGHHHHGHKHAHDFSDVERWTQFFDSPDRDAYQQPELVLHRVGIKNDSISADIGGGTGILFSLNT
jgi:predicted metalloprotease